MRGNGAPQSRRSPPDARDALKNRFGADPTVCGLSNSNRPSGGQFNDHAQRQLAYGC